MKRPTPQVDTLFTFDQEPGRQFDVKSVAATAGSLAETGIHLGTSSWKYPGWCGMLYDSARYTTRGKFSNAKFERTALEEYATVFSTVCVDAGYYKFPDRNTLAKLANQVPDGFLFSFKVTEDITVRRFPSLARYGKRGGQLNPSFLNPDLFRERFLDPLEELDTKLGLLIFEFSRFHGAEDIEPDEFFACLDGFLAALPTGFHYGVEVRNQEFCTPAFFKLLTRRNAQPVLNSWTMMPPISEQLATIPADSSYSARFLLTPGRSYKQAVETFAPYRATATVDEVARRALKKMLTTPPKAKSPRFIYVNNRLEGNALQTIQSAVLALPPSGSPIKS